MSYWHTMVAEGSDLFGVVTLKKDYFADTMKAPGIKSLGV
jgi:xylose isomerase